MTAEVPVLLNRALPAGQGEIWLLPPLRGTYARTSHLSATGVPWASQAPVTR